MKNENRFQAGKNRMSLAADLFLKTVYYNVKIIFANKFIYFFGASFLFFVLIAVINLFSTTDSSSASVYYILLFPGLLMIFYPASFGIQNDEDAGMLEILFSIPNYRYKVWLVRLVMIYVIVSLIMLLFAALSSVALYRIEITEMVYQLMFPVFFFGSLAFLVSTMAKSGSGTAVIVIVIGIIFWISSGILSESEWNIFLNPFENPDSVSSGVWAELITLNRMYIAGAVVVMNLLALLNLQKRERFI